MPLTKKLMLITCALLLSVVSLVWLTSHLHESFSMTQDCHQRDPDSVFFVRLVEQSLLRGEVMSVDEYACYPYKMEHALAPFYLNFVVHCAWAFHAAFPASQIDPVLLCGFLPILFFWLTGLIIFLVVAYLCRDEKFWLFLIAFMLPGVTSIFVGRFLMLDYDYLISFYIWMFLLLAAVYEHNSARLLVYLAGIVVALFVLTWLGTPLFFLLITLYGFFCWLVRSESAAGLIDFFSSTMIAGSVVALAYVVQSPYAITVFSSTRLSLFQPVCVLAGGIFLKLLMLLGDGKNSRKHGIISFAVVAGFVFVFFHQAILQASGFLFKSDPIFNTIAELAPIFTLKKLLSNSDSLADLVKYFNWPVLLLPLLAFAATGNKVARKLSFLRHWLVIMILLAMYQTRYLRWLGAGYGLYCAMVGYLVWSWLRAALAQQRFARLKMCLAFIPLICAFGLNNFSHISRELSLPDDTVELFGWITRNTPKTSGYDDHGRPEYSILCFWDEGNHLAYYTKRPVAVGNYIWGYKTMADVFSAETEAAAEALCDKYGIRYILISATSVPQEICSLWNYLKTQPAQPEYKLVTEKITPVSDYQNWFYFYLAENLGLLPAGNFSTLSGFRAVYLARGKPELTPRYMLFERVKGAELLIEADPESRVNVSLEISFDNRLQVFKKAEVLDKSGQLTIKLPYSTGQTRGRIKTGEYYKLSLFKQGELKRYKVFVSENDVQNASRIGVMHRAVEY